MDVGEWLRWLGLEQYAPAFEENHISPELLPSLTADDLKELGVASVGHRRQLLEAVAALRAKPAAATDVLAPSAAAGSAAERRQLTVIFCDLAGSTALSARLDPEELREVIAAYHRAVAAVVRRFDGLVAKYMGDGVLAYFGYPQADEHDAERAVRAGLALVEAVCGLDTAGMPLQVRV
ncbi:MAG: adenylate/guanylate cyclase domain-containing protein, partial [Alphaproteobacteria bacterium]|nr:adenylate/guanylate cyclase domain-containing protein [Alphaproteobacteria bacterium]